MFKLFEDNILNMYASYTYSLKLYATTKESHNVIIKEHQLDKIHELELSKKVIIAESGATTLTITDLSISSFPNVTEGSYYTSINFDIMQPKGFSFIESIVIASALCGWDDLIQDPSLLLEISFIGIEDKENYTITNDDIYTITLPIKLTNVNSEISNKGAKYNVTAALIFNPTQTDVSLVPESMTISDVRSFEDFTKKFEESLSVAMKKDNISQNGKSAIVAPHKHFINVTDSAKEYLAGSKVDMAAINSNAIDASSRPMNNTASDGKTFSFPPNISIPKAIEMVLATSPQVQELLAPKDGAAFGVTFTIEPTMEYGEFNVATGKHAMHITWHIQDKKVLLPSDNIINENDLMQSLLDNGILRKSYQYYFTGLNNDVIEADIKMNDIWFNKLAKYNNIFLNSTAQLNNTASSAKTEEAINEYKTMSAELVKNMGKYKSTSNSTPNTEVYYVDHVPNADVTKLYRFKNKFQKDSTSTSAAETVAVEEGSESKRTNHRLTLENVRNNIKHSLMNLNLEVRGDPYWLIPSHSVYTSKRFGTTPNVFNLISFFMGYPNEVQEQGARTDYLYSGLYQVVGVTSSFNSGKFTQKLTCVRITDIQGYLVEDRLFGEDD